MYRNRLLSLCLDLQTLPTRLCLALAVASASATARASDLHFSVSATGPRHSISPYIYGTNSPSLSGTTVAPMLRLGGNRWTAYNWENNASNAGSDYLYQSDNYLVNSNTPGAAIANTLASTTTKNQALVITIPTAGYVAADKSGPVAAADYAPANGTATNPAYTGTRFKVSKPAKGSAFTLTPSTSDGFVYQDEYVNWIQTQIATQARTSPVFYSLDNEPDLWSSTHAEIRKNPTTGASVPATYGELRDRAIQYATAIKAVAPNAKVFGAVNYGFYGMQKLQGATDAASQAWEASHPGSTFTAFYLDAMKKADTAAGKRLLDVLDVHYYPEALGVNASGGTTRITENNNDPGVVTARLQAPRSLWDATYAENSWITNDYLKYTNDKTLHLDSRLQAEVNTYYPGTRLSITEYNFGGGNHISGAVAEADALGIFGRDNLFSASYWDLTSGGANSAFARAGFDMYLNYNGSGGKFGDTSLAAATGSSAEDAQSSIYASLSSTTPNLLTLVALNKTANILTADVDLSTFNQAFKSLLGYRLTSASTTSTLFDTRAISGTTITLTLAPYSVNTFALMSVPGDYNGDGFVDAADYTTWADHFGQTGAAVLGDGNFDGKVDAADYTVWADHFGQGAPPPPGGAIPEPHSAVVPVMALAALRRPRERSRARAFR